MGAHVLVVDDDADERHHIEQILKSQGHSVESVTGGEMALARLSKKAAAPVSAIILDLVMPDLDGMAVLGRLRESVRDIPVIVQTSARGSDASGSALRAGASDFLVKPATAERVKASLANALKTAALEREVQRFRRNRLKPLPLAGIVAKSPSMQRAISLCERAAGSSMPVLIEGGAGTGKELAARAIHGSSARADQPFVRMRIERLMAADVGRELFGASGAKDGGKLGAACRGTLFIQGIDALPLDVQSKLAKMLAASANARKQPVLAGDVRLVASSSRRLTGLVADGKFHESLFHHLNVHPIWLPPLKERQADIPELALHLVVRLAAEVGRTGVGGISSQAMELLLRHDWPGNLRELEQTILRAVAGCEGGDLTPQHFPSLHGEARSERQEPAQSAGVPENGVAVARQSNGHRPAVADRISFARYGMVRLLDEQGEMRPIGTLEEEVIRFAIGHYRGRMTEVARRLGIGRSTLYRKMRDYGIAPGQPVVS